MKMFKLPLVLGLALGLLALDGATPNTASAQEIQVTGPLAGAPAVRRMRLYRQGRLLLEPNFSMTLQDEYQRSMIAGLHAGYYFTDWLGVGLWGGYNVAGLDTGLTNEIVDGGVTTSRNRLSLPSAENFDEQIANLQWVAALQLEFIPLRGKLSIFQKLFVDTDFYIFLGFAMVGIEERANVITEAGQTGPCAAAGTTCLDTQTARESRVAPAVTFGFGLSMYINNFLALNINYRGLPFSWNTSGFDNSGSADGDFPDGNIDANDRFYKFNHMVTLGLSIYLPTDPTVTE